MANTQFPGLKYQVQESIFDAKSMLDEQNFYHQRQGSPSVLSSQLTYILGDKNYPISAMTIGASAGYGAQGTVKEIDDIQFTYPVMGRDDKVSITSDTVYATGDKPGLGNQPFYLIFADNWIKRFFKIVSENGTQAYVLEDPEPVANGFRYKVQLDPATATESCPEADFLTSGVKWIELHTAVAESESRTTESKMAMPGMFKNQMSIMRTGWSWAGNASNKMMKIKVAAGAKETEVWMDFAMWQYEKRWLNDCEHFYWYSKYNRQADGTIPLKDYLTAKAIPIGSGILEQIINRSTYSKLSFNSLSNKIGDALFGDSSSSSMTITLMTGTGGMREFDRAMKDAGITLLGNLGAGDIASKFVSGTGRELALGGFFDKFYHVDGYTIKVKHNPIFDIGRMAMVGKLHPESGLPIESYRMVFIDDSDVDGVPNLQFVTQKGRSQIEKVIPGLAELPRSLQAMVGSTGKMSVTDQDKSSYTRLKTGGIQIMRANRCFDLQCSLGV